MLDADRSVVKIDGAPFESDDLASAQTEVRCQEDADVYRIVLGDVEQFLQLGCVVVLSDILHSFRAVGLLDGV